VSGGDHVARQFLRLAPTVALKDVQRRSQDLHVIELLPGERVRGHNVQRMSLHRADERQRHTRVAGGVLDDRDAGAKTPVRLGGLDHRQRHSVLHAAGGILGLELHQDASAAGRHDVAQRDERGAADAVQDVGAQRVHGASLGHIASESHRQERHY
jgi:hypothetical protein